MAVTDIATRTYNHNFRLDPIVRSLLDTDFYKLLMLQMIRQALSGRAGHLRADQPDQDGAAGRDRSTRANCARSSIMRGRCGSPRRS